MQCCRTNFNLEAMSRFAWGHGIYLSKYPTTSLLYGEALVVCKVLLGRRQATDATPVANGIAAIELGVQFHRHFEFWAQNWEQNSAKFWDNFSIRSLHVKTCLKTSKVSWDRFLARFWDKK